LATERFYEGDELLAEITDTHLIVRKRGQQYEYRLDSLTGAYPIASHESGSDHNVFFKTQRPYEDTIAVVFADREGAERFRNAVSAAVPRR